MRIWFDGSVAGDISPSPDCLPVCSWPTNCPGRRWPRRLGLALLWKAPRQTLLGFVPAAALVAAGFFGTNWLAHHSLRPPYMHRGESDNWYRLRLRANGRQVESYWKHPHGIDRGEPSPAVYAMHALVGHHGIFSLTPVWLLALGALLWLVQKQDRRLRELALLIGAITVVCMAFYIARPMTDRNYGGMTGGFRWVFWLRRCGLWSCSPRPT